MEKISYSILNLKKEKKTSTDSYDREKKYLVLYSFCFCQKLNILKSY